MKTWKRRVLTITVMVASVAVCSAEEIFISEYSEGSDVKKRAALDLAVELYNPTGVAVNLGSENFKIWIFADGSFTPTAQISLSGTIAAGGTFVIANTGASVEILAVADQVSASLVYDGNDALVLLRTGFGRQFETYLDAVGQAGFDPPEGCWCYPYPGCTCDDPLSTLDAVLRRAPDYPGGIVIPTDPFSIDPLQWQGFPAGTTCGLGLPGYGCAEIFIDGFESQLENWTAVVQ